MKQRDLKLDEYGISRNRYRELKYFCRQHDEKKTAWRRMLAYQDKDASNVLWKDIEDVETSALEADAENAAAIIENVTRGIVLRNVEYIGGERQFWAARRRFFWILDKRKKGNRGDSAL